MSEGLLYLVVEDEAGERQRIALDGDVWTIGRAEDNRLRLADRNVSRHHARLNCSQMPVLLEDLRSSYGIRFQGKRIQERCYLDPGDVFYIGDFRLEIHNSISEHADTTQRLMLDPAEEVTMTRQGQLPAKDPKSSVQGLGIVSPSTHAPSLPTSSSAKSAHKAGPSKAKGAFEHGHHPSQLNGVVHAGSKAVLYCVSHHFPGRLFELRGLESRIGRTTENEIPLGHRSVSRHHCQVLLVSGQFVVRDMDSVNGTWINHERYEQTILKLGDLLELGHIKLRFIPPGQSYRLSEDDLLGMELDQGTHQVWYQQSWALMGFVLMAMVLLTATLWSWGQQGQLESMKIQEPPMVISQGPGQDNMEAQRLMKQGETALRMHQWKRAGSIAHAVLAIEPSSAPAQQLERSAALEQDAQRNYDMAVHAMGQASWEQAWNTLRMIPSTSIYAEQAGAALKQVRQALIADKVQAARLALKAQAMQEALRQMDELDGLELGLTDKLGLRQEFDKLQEQIGGDSKGKGRNAPALNPTPTEAPSSPEGPTAPRPVINVGNPGEDVKNLYLDGAKLLKSGAIDRAVDLFGRCVAKDKNFAPCYRALGIAHTKLGNGSKAARYYRLYLKVDPNAFDADAVRQILAPYGETNSP